MKQALAFTMKVWLTTGIIAPVFYIYATHWTFPDADAQTFNDYFLYYLASVFIGLFCSVFPVLVLLFIVDFIRTRQWTLIKTKLIIFTITELLLGGLTLIVVPPNLQDNNSLLMWLCYGLIIGVSVLFYKLDPIDNL